MTVKWTDNSRRTLRALDAAKGRALEQIGKRAVQHARQKCPDGKENGGTLASSITYRVEDDELSVGSNVEYAPYVELGTGPFFEPPPEWERFETERGSGVGRAYVKPRPYIRPAIEDHVDEYKRLAESELKKG